MYKAIFKIQEECIDEQSQSIFTPFINCYTLHSVVINCNGVSLMQDVDFNFSNEVTNWKVDFKLEKSDRIIFVIDYFYFRPECNDILQFMVDSSYNNPSKTNEIIAKHYIEGQFSLDNGLYKNAVLNFGTVMEGLLNKQLNDSALNNLINSYQGGASTSDMHNIRQLRNRVHPNRINNIQDITRDEAIDARNKLEKNSKDF